MSGLRDRISSQLDREIEVIENSYDDPSERARAIAELERDARHAYQEERERERFERDCFYRDFG